MDFIFLDVRTRQNTPVLKELNKMDDHARVLTFLYVFLMLTWLFILMIRSWDVLFEPERRTE